MCVRNTKISADQKSITNSEVSVAKGDLVSITTRNNHPQEQWSTDDDARQEPTQESGHTPILNPVPFMRSYIDNTAVISRLFTTGYIINGIEIQNSEPDRQFH